MEVKSPDSSENIQFEDLNSLMIRRREELDELIKRGVQPYPYEFPRTDFSQEIITTFSDNVPQRTVAIAGRIMSIRRMGKASFCHVQDMQGKIQVYLKKDHIGDFYDSFKLLDI